MSVPRAEVDGAGGDRGGQGDGVVIGVAGDGLDIGDGGGVGEVAEDQRVGAGAEIDGAAGELRWPG